MQIKGNLKLRNMNNEKPILAIETSDILCSAALYFNNEKYFQSNINLKHSHSEKLFEIIEFLFETANVGKKQISGVAVSGGPGSFTGLRIGMASAKGIAMAANVPVAAVPTFEALAYQVSHCINENSQVIIANKVNRDEVYYSKFQISANSYIFVDELTILNNDDFIAKAQKNKVFGNATALLEGNHSTESVSSPSAEFVAKWAIKFGKDKFNYDYNYLEPNYLKKFLIKERKKK